MRRLQIGSTAILALLALGCAQEAQEAEDESIAATLEAPAALVCSTGASAEDLAGRPSPLDSVMIDIGGAAAKLCYGRPSTKGREMVGGLDPYDTPWRMGANEPTTLHVAFAATIGGVEVEPGSYALYAVPTDGAWTIVVNGNPDRWGVPISDEVRAADIGSFEVMPTQLDAPVETLTFTAEASEGGVDLVFQFESRTFAIPVRRR